MKVLIWCGYYFLYAMIVTIIRQQGFILGGLPTVVLFSLVSWGARATCKAYEKKRNRKKATAIAKAAKDLAVATLEALQRFEKENPSGYLCRSVATKTDTIIFSHFYLGNICIMATENKDLSSIFSERYVAYIHESLKMLNYKNPSFIRIYGERVVFYDRVFASKQGVEEKTSALIEEFKNIIRNDIINNSLAPFSETSPVVITGDIQEELGCMQEVAVFGKFLLSYTKNSMDQVIETIK